MDIGAKGPLRLKAEIRMRSGAREHIDINCVRVAPDPPRETRIEAIMFYKYTEKSVISGIPPSLLSL
jgi:hypothetical protein